MMYYFKDVDIDNFEKVISLTMKEEQQSFLMNNLYSMAQSKVYTDLIPKAIYFDNELIGFLLYKCVRGKSNFIFLKRFMIDREYQGKGYGISAMKSLIGYFKNNFDIEFIELMHYPENVVASFMYERCKFIPTGEIRETEIVRRHYL